MTPRQKAMRARAKRDRAIVAAVHAGETGREVAARLGISESAVSRILAKRKARLPREVHVARLNERGVLSLSPGRPRHYADDPAKRDRYLALRQEVGAREAHRIVNEA